MLKLRAPQTPLLRQVQISSRPLPITTPVGCRRKPTAALPAAPAFPSLNGVAAAYASVIAFVEEEVTGAHDIIGKRADAYMGRCRPLEFRTIPALPKSTSNHGDGARARSLKRVADAISQHNALG